MAAEVNYGGDGELFTGEDKTLRLHVKDSAGVPVDISGWGIAWIVRATARAAGAAIVTKAGTVSGAYNVSPSVNTQRVAVTLTDDETAILTRGLYYHSWKRTDAANEVVLAYGRIGPERTTQE